jgi:hypothetical protein
VITASAGRRKMGGRQTSRNILRSKEGWNGGLTPTPDSRNANGKIECGFTANEKKAAKRPKRYSKQSGVLT